MARWLLASVMVVACGFLASAKAQVIERDGGPAQVEPTVARAGSPDSVYSNLGTFRNQSFPPAGATLQVLNTVTRMAADDLNLVGTPPYSVNGFRFVVTNLNSIDVSARMLVRFYLPDGAGGGPGTLIAAFTYNPIVFTAGRVGTIKTSTKFVLPSSSIWAGIAFDNNGGTSGATAAQLDNLALGIFSPAVLGTSTDRHFVTTAASPNAADNPLGTIANFGGAPPADFGWEILAAQDVDLSITVSDGVATVFPGGSVAYTITASNAGPDTVFGARVVDTFPATLACSWTCAGSAGNSCAASGVGDINDSTVALAAGGSVTYTASCTLSPAATGTLANTATIFAPGTAVDANIADNAATDSDAILSVTAPGPPTSAIALAGNAQAGVAFAAPASNGGSAITSYTATSSPGGITASGAASPIIVSGVTNGTAYTFTVTATNAVGTGPPSAPTNAVTPAAVPGEPTIGTATAGNAQATVTFTPPASNGGSPITSYTVTSSPGGNSAGGAGSPITVTGLTNGTAYTFTVTATNAVGTGLASAPSNSVTPATVPGAPTLAHAVAGDTQALVAFTAPISNGGSAITTYTVTSSPGGITATRSASPVLVNGLTNGTAYSFTVTATNAVGTGPASTPSNSVTPAAVPGPPTIGTAIAGNQQATVTFTPPASNGGSPITAYTVTSSPGGITASGAASPIVVAGLTNGTAYTFTVTATNAIGTGLESAPSNSVTPATIPGAPTIGIATAGNAQATVTFTPPASNGGLHITSYTATSSPGGIVASGAASPIIVSGLTNGTAYTFTVAATNALGPGPDSAPSNSVTPATVPGAPTIGTATPGNAQATIAFTPPASNGGSAITSYTVTSSPGGISASGAGSPITVTGLTNGTAYTFTVKATNALGAGPASAASNSVTPVTVPGAPTSVAALAGNTQAGVAFAAPTSNGGSPITSYTVTSSPGGITASGAGSPLIVSGLTNGTAYTFTVTATNAIGTGPASAPSNSVTPAAVPGPPTIGTATAGNAQATVTFTPPVSNGGSPITSYTATSSPGGISVRAAASPITVTGLTNGTAYTFTVTATNAVGTGLASAPSNGVTPATLPGAPTIGPATASLTQVSVAFTPPASNGGSAITSYTATSAPGGLSASGAASPIAVGGLTPAAAYTFTVTATNAVGTGPASAPSNSVSLATVPGAPTISATAAGNGRATVAFTPPASNGGAAITSYALSCGAFSATGAASPLTVTGLTNGTTYSCSVTATNAAGTGPASAAVSVTPQAIVRSFIGPSATGSGTIVAVFTGGGLTCSFTNSQFIPVSGDPASPPSGPNAAVAFPHGLFDFTLGGCTPASTVTFTIVYPAALPAGTQYWKYGPEPGTPAPHWYVMPATIGGSTVTFSIADGGQGDDDLAGNGTIVDQGGPGVPVAPVEIAPVPTLSQWATMLLALLLAGIAAPKLLRRS